MPQSSGAGAMAEESSHFTHFDAAGQAHMVDIAGKDKSKRVARAGGRIAMRAATLELIRSGSAEKGDVLGVARIAAIQAAKRTAELIPLAHPLPLTRVRVGFALEGAAVVIEVTAETFDRTGVEMEALTGKAARLYEESVNASAVAAAGPPLAAVRPITANFFGTSVEDPYRWMEDPANAELDAWMKRQNDYTRSVLDRIQVRSELLQQIEALSNQGPDARRMHLAQGRLFYLKRGAGDAAFKLCVRGPD